MTEGGNEDAKSQAGRSLPLHKGGDVTGTYVSSILVEKCKQCEVCPPIKECPSGAFQRIDPDYPPFIDQEACMGCGVCVEVCPYRAVILVKKV
ncbi:MAG: ferredoxin [Candidatus Hecatellales archaeon]|nr:MAG: ferredoxin [Candidatus Hecatellales archaeon]